MTMVFSTRPRAEMGSGTASPAATAASRPGVAAWRVDLAVVALLVVATALAWAVSRMGLFDAGDRASYRIAIVGGVMMLMVFLYPLRKQVRALRHLGATRWWLWAHITLGLLGPWLILVHSTFRIGSLNAGVALWSMVIVVLSGVVGRFLHARVHRGLRGERTTLSDLRRQAGLVEADAVGKLHFAPRVAAALTAFEQAETGAPARVGDMLRRLLWLPVRQQLLARQCRRWLREALRDEADAGGRARTQRRAGRWVDRYLGAVVRVSQFAAYERVFALWHVAHVPFVVLLVVSAVVHVVAVHAY
jgi:hypothetical protein